MVKYEKNRYLDIIQPFARKCSWGSCKVRKRTVDDRDEGQIRAAGYTSHRRVRPARPNPSICVVKRKRNENPAPWSRFQYTGLMIDTRAPEAYAALELMFTHFDIVSPLFRKEFGNTCNDDQSVLLYRKLSRVNIEGQ